MKRILLFLLFLHSSTQSEPITAATTIGTVFFSTPMGAAISSSIVKTVGIAATCIAGWFVSKKTKKIQSQSVQKKVKPIKQEFVLKEPIRIEIENKDSNQKNNVIKTKNLCCSECEQNKTTECCAKKKSKNKDSQATEGSIQKQRAAHNQPPEDDPCPPLKERKRLVKDWAREREFRKTEDVPFNNKGMPAYKKGRTYVTVDKDCHGGSIMKMFQGTKNNLQRTGSFDKDFNKLRE